MSNTSEMIEALFERARSLAETSSFCATETLRQLPSMGRAEIDDLPFGIVKVDDTGSIRLYSRYESDIGGLEPSVAEGQNFFHSVAVCTNNDLFLGAFERGIRDNDLNLLFPYTFTYKMRPTNVKVHLYRDKASQTNWILIQRV